MRSDELKARLSDPWDIARLLNLEEGAQRQARGLMVRCPAHPERTPSCSLRRGREGYLVCHCFGCGWSGDVFSLVAVCHGLDVRRDFVAVAQHVASFVGSELETVSTNRALRSPRSSSPRRGSETEDRPPQHEVEQLWDASERVDAVATDDGDKLTAQFLSQRGLEPAALAALDIVRVLPREYEYAFPDWWPAPWARNWRLAVRAFEANDRPASIHARAVRPESTPKTRWPCGRSAKRLLFANGRGLALLRDENTTTHSAVIVEGLTDFLAASIEIAESGREVAVIGACAGGFRALRDIRASTLREIIIATDGDHAGEKYAREILATRSDVTFRRIPLGSIR